MAEIGTPPDDRELAIMMMASAKMALLYNVPIQEVSKQHRDGVVWWCVDNDMSHERAEDLIDATAMERDGPVFQLPPEALDDRALMGRWLTLPKTEQTPAQYAAFIAARFMVANMMNEQQTGSPIDGGAVVQLLAQMHGATRGMFQDWAELIMTDAQASVPVHIASPSHNPPDPELTAKIKVITDRLHLLKD